MADNDLHRRTLLTQGAQLGVALAVTPWLTDFALANEPDTKRTRVGVIGCGSVSNHYFPHLEKCPYAQVVSACDIIPERAERAAKQYGVPHHYPHIDQMLTGEPFDLLVNLTDMQEHERLNRQAIEAGRHVWSEKPLANSYTAGKGLVELAKQRDVRLWGAPTVVNSPQFAFMAQTLADGKLGRVAAAHASYGHLGPDWAEFFYAQGGGSMPDLGVYSLTILTGLLGPARAVTAMTSVVTPKREITGQGEMQVVAEDNASVLLDHGQGCISHMQCGFNYFSAHDHGYTSANHPTISFIGTGGNMNLLGYDWAPHGVELATLQEPNFKRYADAPHDYVWQQGASVVAECLTTGREPLFTVEHALHVLEIIEGARRAQETGQRVKLTSTFKWPVPR